MFLLYVNTGFPLKRVGTPVGLKFKFHYRHSCESRKVSLKLHISEARVERRTPPLRAGDAESRERSGNPENKFLLQN